MPVEEVVQEHKAKLHGHLEPPRKHLVVMQKIKAKEERRMTVVKSQIVRVGNCGLPVWAANTFSG